MKVDFNTAYSPAKNIYSGSNYSVPINGYQNTKAFQNNIQDTFVKTNPAFGRRKQPVVVIYRPEVINAGKEGIVHNLAIYARSFAYAAGHAMPTSWDLDRCMKEYFNLCCAAASTYPEKDDYVRYPSCQEFEEIIAGLWRDSKKLEGVNEDDYINPKTAQMREAQRMPYMRALIKDDIGRAMNLLSLERYGKPINDEDEAREFAYKIYNDKTTRTIKPSVSKSVQKLGVKSPYHQLLTQEFDSADILRYLREHKDKFFGPPRSLRKRFDDYKFIFFGVTVDNKEEPEEVIYDDDDGPSDKRTDWERWFDEHGL